MRKKQRKPRRKLIPTEVPGNASFKDVVLAPQNRSAVNAFTLVSACLVLAPGLLFSLGSRYAWSVEVWGVCSVVVMNIIIGFYVYYVLMEERNSQK